MLTDTLGGAFITQRQLAEAAGVDYETLRKYLRGERTPPLAVARRITKALREHGRTVIAECDALDRWLDEKGESWPRP